MLKKFICSIDFNFIEFYWILRENVAWFLLKNKENKRKIRTKIKQKANNREKDEALNPWLLLSLIYLFYTYSKCHHFPFIINITSIILFFHKSIFLSTSSSLPSSATPASRCRINQRLLITRFCFVFFSYSSQVLQLLFLIINKNVSYGFEFSNKATIKYIMSRILPFKCVDKVILED